MTTNPFAGPAVVLGGGTLAIRGKSGTTNSQQFNGLGIMPAASALTATSGDGGTLNVSLGGITYNIGGTIDFILPISGTISAQAASEVNGPTYFAWPCGAANWNSIAYATVNGGSTWATLPSDGGAIGC